MSILGKRHFRDVRFTPNSDRKSGLPQKVMSASPSKRTCAVQTVMSAKGQKRTYHDLLDHFVRGDQQPRRNSNAERLRCSNVDGCSEFGRGLYWEIGGFVAAQNTVNIGCRQSEYLVLIGRIGHEAAGRDKKIKSVDRGQFVPGRKRDDEIAMHDGGAIRRQEQASVRCTRD